MLVRTERTMLVAEIDILCIAGCVLANLMSSSLRSYGSAMILTQRVLAELYTVTAGSMICAVHLPADGSSATSGPTMENKCITFPDGQLKGSFVPVDITNHNTATSQCIFFKQPQLF
jgi:hypothetical protein